jgi:hypothetical protein
MDNLSLTALKRGETPLVRRVFRETGWAPKKGRRKSLTRIPRSSHHFTLLDLLSSIFDLTL